MTVDTVEKLLVAELKDLYSVEKQITRALPKMAKAASNDQLKTAFETHLQQTQGQIGRLDRVFEILGKPASGKPAKACRASSKKARRPWRRLKAKSAMRP